MSNLLWQMQRSMACVIVEQGLGPNHKIVSLTELATEECAARRKDEHGVTTPP
jgi:hypothetical protein